MRKRTAFRPDALDALEERLTLSSSGISSFLPTSIFNNLASAFHIGNKSTPKPTVTVGTLGDSYTDEYRFHPPDQSQARNWVEILASTRKAITFGPFTTASRGEPRNQGFASNWARFGATSNDMVRNQLPGLAAQVSKGQVKYAWIFIGGNDFLEVLQGVQNGQIPPAQVPSAVAVAEAVAKANFTTAVNTLLAANPRVKLVVATVPDVALLPLVQEGERLNPASQLLVQATSNAIQRYNALITATANGNSSRIALVDLAGQSAQLLSAGGATGTASFGGATINLTTPGDNYHDFFLADGIHIGTVGQGIIAADFISAIDSHFGAKVAPLTPQQIIAFARSVRPSTP
jgi:phospholipase/lecithinase/hemolysin